MGLVPATKVPVVERVRFSHIRSYDDNGTELMLARRDAHVLGLGAPRPNGGITLVEVKFTNGTRARGVARCAPCDNFCKKTGRQIAVGRALKAYIAEHSNGRGEFYLTDEGWTS